MERGRFYQQFGEKSGSGEAGSARQFVTDLIQRQQLTVGDINQYYDMWVGLQSESADYVPQHLTKTMRNISLGLGFLFNNQWAEMGNTGRSKQVAFQKRLQRWNKEYKGQLVLTHEEGLLLRDAAAAVNVAYDPGGAEDTPDDVKKRTFVFADLSGRSPSTANVVDAVK
jgi:hypothetical protein